MDEPLQPRSRPGSRAPRAALTAALLLAGLLLAPMPSCGRAAEASGGARRKVERVVLVVHGSQPALQCALLLNSAKASMLVQEWPTALARAMRAERIAAHDAVEPEKTRALRRTALIVCARCNLAMSKFGKATTFAARLLAADLPPGADEKAQAAATLMPTLPPRVALEEVEFFSDLVG